MLISREVVKPDYAMFVSLAEDHRYHIHSASKHQPHHLDYFKFMGRVWGKAAYDGFLIESHLTSAVYKYLLGIPITRVNALLPRQHTTNHHTLLSLPPSTMTKAKAQARARNFKYNTLGREPLSRFNVGTSAGRPSACGWRIPSVVAVATRQ